VSISIGQRLRTGACDPAFVLIEGFHALKHAHRFGAELELVATADREGALELCTRLAPDLTPVLQAAELAADRSELEIAGRDIPTGVIALARRPAEVDTARAAGMIVLLEAPRNPANAGAAIRAAAAARVAAVAVTGDQDPWHPAAVRGSAGLHFAQPVLRGTITELTGERPVLGLDPDGELLRPRDVADNAVLVFGSERDGLSAEARERCSQLVRLPMRAGVSSLNLATSVSATLMAVRIANGWQGGEQQ